MVFGCGIYNEDSGWFSGIVGASHPLSLYTELGFSHFSYYIFIDNGGKLDGEVHFGPRASLSGTGANTPFISHDSGHYYLELLWISVDGSDLDIRNYMFGDVVIYSGTSYTALPKQSFEVLKEAKLNSMYMYTQVDDKDEELELCYNYYDDGGAPEVVFQFKRWDFALCDTNLWLKDCYDIHCLTFSSINKNITIIGMFQQKNVQVGYDLEKDLLTLNSPDVCPNVYVKL